MISQSGNVNKECLLVEGLHSFNTSHLSVGFHYIHCMALKAREKHL